KAAEAAGHKVTLVNVTRKKIAGCLACEYCHGKGNGACIQKDDMQELYPFLTEAEVLVLASPIYYFTFSAQIQSAIQRFYAIWKPANVKRPRFFFRPIRRTSMTVQSPNTRESSPSADMRTSASSPPEQMNRRPRQRAGRFSNSSEKFDTRLDEMREMILNPEIPEMCRNEIEDFLLELVQRELRNIPEGTQSRRYNIWSLPNTGTEC
ncbi:MAG: flavodoxin family protein, partial [Lentisphaeria bacterium]|nr:flavodoxin family protein [Lentisphaeria bacterium]